MTDYELIIKQMEALAEESADPIPVMANVSALLFNSMEYVNWAGFYLVKDDTLVLGPFQGNVAPEAQRQYLIRGENALCAAAARIGPGGAGLSTFLSPLEKAAGNAIIKAGGSLIILSMEGFAPRWHPSEKQERFCADGRMLYLSPYEPQAAKLTRQEMYSRAHALVDWALAHSHEHLEAWR